MAAPLTPSLEIWLPPAGLWPTGPAGPGAWLARAKVLPAGPTDSYQLLRQAFASGGEGSAMPSLPVAALLRQYWHGDAGAATWLCADPAWIQPDLNGARLMACQHLALGADDARSLVAALAPLFAEQQMQLQVGEAGYWQLRVDDNAPMPDWTDPNQALGGDVLAYLPQGAVGRRWRILLNEAQTVLHAHPLNQQRLAQGLPPVNSIWLWGAGPLPPRWHSRWQAVISADPIVQAAAGWAALPALPFEPSAVADLKGAWLLDLQSVRGAAMQPWMAAIATLAKRWPLQLRLDDGRRYLHQPWHRWRRWRSAWTG